MTVASPLVVLAFLFTLPSTSRAAEPHRLKVAIHLHSTVSTGELEPSQIATLAASRGLDGVIVTDSVLREWEYGLWPFRGLLKWVVRQPSILAYGPERYEQVIEAAGEQTPGVLMIPGAEAAPFYYWRRPPFHSRGGQMRSWHRHLLVFGLSPEVLRRLPLQASNPYHGDQGSAPYQRLIDAVKADDGLVFWAHPLAKHVSHRGRIEIYTEPYPHLLEHTRNYHGIAIADKPQRALLEPGGLWDRLLLAYCRGKREHSVWIIGELDWHAPQEGLLDVVVTEVMAEARRPAAVLQALRAGRMWTVFRRRADLPAPTLLKMTITDVNSGAETVSGGRVTPTGPLRIELSGRRSADVNGPGRVLLIKDGAVSDVQDIGDPSFELVWDEPAPGQPGFYRAVIDDPSGLVYTNPIFVQ